MVRQTKGYDTQFPLRLSSELKEVCYKKAEELNISLNDLIVTIISEYFDKNTNSLWSEIEKLKEELNEHKEKLNEHKEVIEALELYIQATRKINDEEVDKK